MCVGGGWGGAVAIRNLRGGGDTATTSTMVQVAAVDTAVGTGLRIKVWWMG